MKSLPYEFRYARLIYIRWPLACPVLVALFGLATNYLFRGVQNPQQQPLISAFDEVPVLWPAVFIVPLAVMLVALITRNFIAQAYVVACVAFWLYGIALLYGAVTVGAGWATASLSLAGSLCCIVLGLTYAKGR